MQSGNRDLYLSALIAEIIIVGLTGFVVLYLLGLWNILSALLLVGQLLNIWTHAQRIMYERKFQYKALSILETGTYLVSHVFAVVGVLFGFGALVLYLRIWIQGFGQLAALHRIGGIGKFRLRLLGKREWRHVVRQSRQFWIDGVLDQSYDRMVILLVGNLSDDRTTGCFFQAYKFVTTLHHLVRPLAERVLFNYLSHRVESARRFNVLRKLILVETVFLSVVAIVTVVCSSILVAALFGPGWEPVPPLLNAMAGAIAFAAAFSSLRAYYKAEGDMLPFIVFGRGGQYIALVVAFTGVLVLNMDSAQTIGLGISCGFLAGSILSLSVTYLRNRKR